MAIRRAQFFRLLPVLLLIFLDSFSYFVVIPILLKLFYHAKYGLLPATLSPAWRDILVGIIIPISTLAALIASPWIGSASDQWGRKKTILFCLAVVTLGFLLQYMSIVLKSVALIFVGRIITGVGSASQPIAQAAIADIFGKDAKDKSIFLMLNATMMTLALIAAPMCGGYLSDASVVSWFSIKTPYLFAMTLSIANLLLILFFFQETLAASKPKIHRLSEVVTHLPRLMKQFRFGRWLLVFLCFELGWSQYYQSISMFLSRQLHISMKTISFFNMITGIEMAVGLLLTYPIFLRFFSLKRIIRWSAFFTMSALILCALFPMMWMQWMMMPIVAVFTGTLYIAIITLISDCVGADMQGLVMGYISTTLFLAWMITAADGGFLFALHSELPLWIAALFLVVAFFATGGIYEVSRRIDSKIG
ncbi:MAG: hypothetical protein A3I77_00790 [Gammaproteobacteria bacterium RIFCSPLOWO2_02_FULL_42_14]|nr:MAG: hypothetical protein A3B71_04580 [Gammaproteobacteria bacterium RIFCSPHIGHO2_02_FULL_42_43]OGT27618.1 MAG: hypothetical protein A2624_00070 [Gammaproteobacteria bacterium RIFCSPHIGHO2_01_FULL_42_8]OGT53139.1 MAG: hypothetical protein A3E54_08440 [Gammaproteobacteria bacterium RIFCSPHIGHO2_12_FULL_41_25]OGT60968.1 MAG: hypothetical protein A3I77_00790 [Gammaproteobacteria bacterium RIFCSPLOWO2_02_FULL_42_14]OGT85284.1 MAG: hypothetical protein A3G86_05425 [Gammaproteobacteria bacterium R